jgi:hypothetical protein
VLDVAGLHGDEPFGTSEEQIVGSRFTFGHSDWPGDKLRMQRTVKRFTELESIYRFCSGRRRDRRAGEGGCDCEPDHGRCGTEG